MNSISDHLARVFFDLPIHVEYTELLQLLSLEEKEFEEKFNNNYELREKYKFSNTVNTMEEVLSEPDTEPSDSEIDYYNLKPSTVESIAETSLSGSKRKSTETNYIGKDPNHQGIPKSLRNDNQIAVNIINIDCIYNLDERRIAIDRWATEISLIVQSHRSDYLKANYLDSSPHEELPKHLTLHPIQYKGLVNRIIESQSIGLKINELLVVEYYSRQNHLFY